MDWSIQDTARLAHTTSRTLRHYGEVGLLTPSRIGTNGYRYYDERALVRLQRILMLRELGLGLLAIPGVVLTAVVVGGAAALAFGLPFEVGFLIGAVVAPTDPAILIPLFERIRVRPKVVQTVIAESALNDPIGAVLALTLAAYVVEGGGSVGEPSIEFVRDLTISALFGLVFGGVLAAVLSARRFGIWREAPALVMGAVIADSYLSIDFAGGSGYLGAFIAGVIAGNAPALGLRPPSHRERELALIAGFVTEVVVIFVFVLLGASLPIATVADNILPGLLVVLVLLVVARPLAVGACLGIDRRGRWTRAEIGFVAWTRETGVVPASVAGILIAQGVPNQDELVTVVALAIVVTLLLQSTTKAWLARRLGLVEPEPPTATA
jgi:cell volume regulation protein A